MSDTPTYDELLSKLKELSDILDDYEHFADPLFLGKSALTWKKLQEKEIVVNKSSFDGSCCQEEKRDGYWPHLDQLIKDQKITLAQCDALEQILEEMLENYGSLAHKAFLSLDGCWGGWARIGVENEDEAEDNCREVTQILENMKNRCSCFLSPFTEYTKAKRGFQGEIESVDELKDAFFSTPFSIISTLIMDQTMLFQKKLDDSVGQTLIMSPLKPSM